MKHMTRALPLLAILICLIGGCIKKADPYKFVFPGDVSARARVQEDLDNNIRLLKQNDKVLVLTYEAQATSLQETTGKPMPDRTLGEVVAYEKARIQESLNKKNQPPAPTAAQTAMIDLIGLTVLNKQSIVNVEGKISDGDQVVLTIGIRNKGAKDIRSIVGRVLANLPSGQSFTIDLNISDRIGAGQGVAWQAPIKLQGPEDKNLLNADKSQIKAVFDPQSITFADGTRMTLFGTMAK